MLGRLSVLAVVVAVGLHFGDHLLPSWASYESLGGGTGGSSSGATPTDRIVRRSYTGTTVGRMCRCAPMSLTNRPTVTSLCVISVANGVCVDSHSIVTCRVTGYPSSTCHPTIIHHTVYQ